MLNIKKIKPMFNALVTTAEKETKDTVENGVITRQGGTLKDIQKVVAAGPMVKDIKVGDLVKINPNRYAVTKRDKNSLANDIEGGNQVLKYNFNFIEMDNVLYMRLFDNDIEYIVEEYEELEDPKESPIIVPNTQIIC